MTMRRRAASFRWRSGRSASFTATSAPRPSTPWISISVAPGRSAEDALGAVSLVIWTLTLIVAIKYALLVLRAQNDGEGGVFALYGLLHDSADARARMAVVGSDGRRRALDRRRDDHAGDQRALRGGGPGRRRAGLFQRGHSDHPRPSRALFAIQFKGASSVGALFGPVVLVWFLGIAVLGAAEIDAEPQILAAFNPVYGARFLAHAHFVEALLILGALMLVVTGGEAMYADLGHFGALPIRLSWYAIVYPALLLNYLGQGAYLLGAGPIADDKLFFALAPHWLVMPMVVLATAATVIASQSLISGAFSLVSQAIRLGLFPNSKSATPTTRARGRSIFRSSTGCCSSAAWRWCGPSARARRWRRPTASPCRG